VPQALRRVVRAQLPASVRYVEVDCAINEAGFVRAVQGVFREMLVEEVRS
jgi:hypothetical protein